MTTNQILHSDSLEAMKSIESASIDLTVTDYRKICPICGSEFQARKGENPYRFRKRVCCSRSCNAIYVAKKYCAGKPAHNRNKMERICQNCGKIEYVPKSHSDRPYCSRECMAKDYKIKYNRKNHWNWQGGITEDKARDVIYDGYKEWRKSVYRRDNFTCQICGEDKSGCLVAHHIKSLKNYPELVCNVNNGITLCQKCHKMIHYGNKEYVKIAEARINAVQPNLFSIPINVKKNIIGWHLRGG